MRTPCGLRAVVTILEIFAELLGDTFGKVPCYSTVENRVKKLGLSVYQDEQPCKDKKFAMVVDESIAINGQKLLLTLAIPSKHQNRPIKHDFVLTILLYPKVSNESVTKTINFKERIVNVKLKDISTWSTEHLSKNWVKERTKTLRKVS